MNWQEITVLGVVALAAIQSSRVFLQQFEAGSVKGEANCAKCPGCALTQSSSQRRMPQMLRIAQKDR